MRHRALYVCGIPVHVEDEEGEPRECLEVRERKRVRVGGAGAPDGIEGSLLKAAYRCHFTIHLNTAY